MKITIDVTKKEADHLQSPHTFYDSCEEADAILVKVQKQIDIKLKQKYPSCTAPIGEYCSKHRVTHGKLKRRR